MAHKRKDTLVPTGSWNVHMKPDGKRTHNKAERRASKGAIIIDMADVVNLLTEAEKFADKDFPTDFWDC